MEPSSKVFDLMQHVTAAKSDDNDHESVASDTLFIGWGGPEGVSHYRTILPARHLGAEWVIFDMNGKPICGEGTSKSHKTVIVQNCWYPWQLRMVQRIKATGATVLFNVDDWIKSIGKMDGAHGLNNIFADKKLLNDHSLIFKASDGVIASTDWIADKILRTGMHDNVLVARNGIDEQRYKPWMDVERDMGVIIGWAGGTGHTAALRGIADVVADVVKRHEDVHLWIVGQDERKLFNCPAHHADWSDMLVYPRSLACFDISLAPAQDNDFYKGKSQLRLYEALTLGTPSLVHPMYDEVGMAGTACRTSEEWAANLEALATDQSIRDAMRFHALKQAESVSMKVRIGEWVAAIEGLTHA